jgi:hypothetical protein
MQIIFLFLSQQGTGMHCSVIGNRTTSHKILVFCGCRAVEILGCSGSAIREAVNVSRGIVLMPREHECRCSISFEVRQETAVWADARLGLDPARVLPIIGLLFQQPLANMSQLLAL